MSIVLTRNFRDPRVLILPDREVLLLLYVWSFWFSFGQFQLITWVRAGARNLRPGHKLGSDGFLHNISSLFPCLLFFLTFSFLVTLSLCQSVGPSEGPDLLFIAESWSYFCFCPYPTIGTDSIALLELPQWLGPVKNQPLRPPVSGPVLSYVVMP